VDGFEKTVIPQIPSEPAKFSTQSRNIAPAPAHAFRCKCAFREERQEKQIRIKKRNCSRAGCFLAETHPREERALAGKTSDYRFT